MKALLCILLLIAIVNAISFNPQEIRTNGWYVPQLDGTFVWMTENEYQNLDKQNILDSRNGAVVKYFLYTNENPYTPQLLVANDAKSLENSGFNKALPTRIIIHGWKNNYQSNVNVDLRSALLETGNYNVICVDWSSRSETINYPRSVMNVPNVGEQVANFIDFLHTNGGMSFETLTVMGHSLGAHVSGFAGKNVKNGKIHQIIGMDPAYPLYSYDKPNERLNKNDAVYVESIQTCCGLYGFLKPIGKSAFYPNGGKKQPGCGLDLLGVCAHSRSYEYYAEAIREDNFPTIKCINYSEAVDKTCGSAYSPVLMGASTNYINAFGEYYVPVKKNAPFGYGTVQATKRDII